MEPLVTGASILLELILSGVELHDREYYSTAACALSQKIILSLLFISGLGYRILKVAQSILV